MRVGWRSFGRGTPIRVWHGLRRPQSLRLTAPCLALLLLCFGTAWPGLSAAQTAKPAAAVRSVFVAPAEQSTAKSDAPEALRQRVIERLQHSKALQLAPDEASAGSVLRVRAVIWPTGTVTLNPKSQADSFTNYEGYATAYLYAGSGTTAPAAQAGHPGRVLWAYLATPKPFHFDGILDDLAGQIAAGLDRAVGRGLTTASAAKDASLEVAGGTLPAPLYLKWFESFQGQPGGVPMTYDAVGSVAGIEELRAGRIDMAASDIPAAAGGDQSAGGNVLRIPSVAGAIVPIYNLAAGNAAAAGDLNLTGALLAAIYAGSITMWDDPAIASANRGTRLPHAAISVVHRSDGSGTTFVWTSFLAQSDPAWKPRVGAAIDWPLGIGVFGNEGVSEQVARTPNSIGYVELAYAIQHRLRYAAVRNPAGRYVRASLESISAAAGAAAGSGGLVLNAPGKDAYPIATFTWLLVPQSAGSAEKRASIKAFLRWMLTSGQKQCASLGYAPLPRALAAEELKAADALQ